MSEVISFTSIPMAHERGLTEQDLRLACLQVSGMIDAHNAETRETYRVAHGTYPETDEMLPKTPQELFEQLQRGQSVYIVERDSDDRIVTHHHSSLYELFSPGLALRLGYQLFELGSAITLKESRGHGYGQRGADLRRAMMMSYAERNNVADVAVTTVKRTVTRHVWEKQGAKLVPFHDYPFVASQTCSCPRVSEMFHTAPCQFRRTRAQSIGEHAIPLVMARGSANEEMPCTLITPDIERLDAFENRCRRLYTHFYGNEAPIGYITQSVFHQAAAMFARIEHMPEHKVRELIRELGA